MTAKSHPKVDQDLAAHLATLGRGSGGLVRIDDVAGVVESLLATMRGDLTAADIRLYPELEGLSRFIQATRAEIAALRPDDVRDRYLPAAADEMDAIVAATASATHAIMDATESIEKVMGTVGPDIQDTLVNATTRIYEACGFQDITGQRITKVVKALKEIERKVDALISAFGDEIEKVKMRPAEPVAKEGPRPDADLLHGPQLPGQGRTQEEIDRLLASFK